MRLMMFQDAGAAQLGVVDGDDVVAVSGSGVPGDLLGVIEGGAAARDAVFAIDGVVDAILQYAVGGWRRAHWGSVLDAPRDDGRWFHAQYVEPERSDAPCDSVRTFRSAPELSNVVLRGGKLATLLRDLDSLCKDMLISDLELYGMNLDQAKNIAKKLSKK